MNFELTSHAEEELARRGIPKGLLDELLAAPQQVVPAYGDMKAYQSQVDFGGGRMYLLRAIVSEREGSAIVVTVYRTSRISKYWREQ